MLDFIIVVIAIDKLLGVVDADYLNRWAVGDLIINSKYRQGARAVDEATINQKF